MWIGDLPRVVFPPIHPPASPPPLSQSSSSQTVALLLQVTRLPPGNPAPSFKILFGFKSITETFQRFLLQGNCRDSFRRLFFCLASVLKMRLSPSCNITQSELSHYLIILFVRGVINYAACCKVAPPLKPHHAFDLHDARESINHRSPRMFKETQQSFQGQSSARGMFSKSQNKLSLEDFLLL